MEGSAGDLEAEAGEDEGDGDVGQRLDMGGGAERGGDVKDVGGAGGAVEQGDSVEEEAGGEGAEEEILHRAFGALGGVAAEAGEDVAGDGGDFQGDEDEHQLDRRGHEAGAHRAEQDQRVVLAVIDLLEGQVVERHEDGGQGDQQDHDVEEDAEVIDPDHVAEAEAGIGRLGLAVGGGQGDQDAEGGEDAQTLAAASGGQYGLDEHDEHAPDGEDDFRKDADVIRGCRHGYRHGYLSTI